MFRSVHGRKQLFSEGIRHNSFAPAIPRKLPESDPTSLDYYCEFLGLTKQHFYDLVEPMRDAKIWEKQNGSWLAKDAVWKQPTTDANDRHRCVQSGERTFAPKNRHLYYNPRCPRFPRAILRST